MTWSSPSRRAARPKRSSAWCPACGGWGVSLVAITERATSSLGQAADLCIALGPIEEACPLGLAPSASTTALMAVGDALALLVSRMRDFSPEDFASTIPAAAWAGS